MRVKVDNFGKPPYFGRFIGLLAPSGCDRCDWSETPSVIVLTDGFGLFVQSVHPSRVTFVTPAEEENYKP